MYYRALLKVGTACVIEFIQIFNISNVENVEEEKEDLHTRLSICLGGLVKAQHVSCLFLFLLRLQSKCMINIMTGPGTRCR